MMLCHRPDPIYQSSLKRIYKCQIINLQAVLYPELTTKNFGKQKVKKRKREHERKEEIKRQQVTKHLMSMYFYSSEIALRRVFCITFSFFKL